MLPLKGKMIYILVSMSLDSQVNVNAKVIFDGEEAS